VFTTLDVQLISRMKNLNLPDFDFRTRKLNNKTEIFDEFRNKFVVLTPEEWVRQNLLKYLNIEKNIPKGLMSIEKGLTVNRLKKRTDIVIYNRKGNPSMIVECKAPEIKISQDTFEQIARYNMTLKVDYLLVSNGLMHYCCKIDFKKQQFTFIENIPDFNQMND
jgi:hypothetical protein